MDQLSTISMKIRTHLVMLVGAVLLPVLIFAAVLTGLFWLQQRANFDQRYLEQVRAVSLALDTEIQTSIRVLDALEFTSEIDLRQPSQFANKARRLLLSQPSWSAIVLADPAGNRIIEVGRETDSLPRGAVDSNTFKRVVGTQAPAVSGFVRLEDGRRVTEIAVPVVRRNAMTYVLVAYIDASFWLGFMGRIEMLPDATMTLVDQNGIIIARTLSHERWVGKPPSPTLLEKARESAEGAYRNFGLEGQWFYTAHRRSAATGWTIATGVPADSVEAALRGSTLWMVGVSLLTGVLAIFFAVVLGRRIADPVAGLAASVRALTSHGAAATPAPQARGIEEVEKVVRVFEEARTLLREREQALNNALAGEQQARAAAEAANRGKDEFLAMLGHELRNPLGVIANAVTVMDRAGSDAAAVRSREIVHRQISHLRQLVDDLLDVARVTMGKIVLNTRALDLAKTARRTIAVLQDAKRFASHQIDAELAEAWVAADETRIEQILVNLLENAVKYTPAGGRIRVRVRADKRTAVLEVSDTGAGIAPNLLPYVFDIFTQGERTLDRSQGGLGLGLTLVRRLVELHHGHVTAGSDGLRRGSTFTVELPRIDAPAAAVEPPPANPSSARRLRVLIVEDNVDGRETLKAILTLCGHEVYEAADGLNGAEVAIAVRPDIALIDIGLPGIDGYEVARRVRASPHGRQVKLVACTGYGQQEDLQRAKLAGFDACLVKPLEPAALERILAEV